MKKKTLLQEKKQHCEKKHKKKVLFFKNTGYEDCYLFLF